MRRRGIFLIICVLMIGALVGLFLPSNSLDRLRRRPSSAVGSPGDCEHGVVSFCIAAQEKGGKVTLPALRPEISYWEAERTTDEDGLPYRQTGSGEQYRNVSEIAFQMFDPHPFDVEEVCRDFQFNRKAVAGLAWIKKHERPLEPDAIAWDYNFPLQVNDVVIYPPWPSAFSQSAVIERLLLAHCASRDREYLETARRAALAFKILVTHGGLRSEDPNFTWFQEVPLPDRINPFILNGHLYAIYVLNLLHPYFPEEGFDRLADLGLQSVLQILPVIDTGYWNRYDLRPRYPAFNIGLAKSDVVLKSLAVRIGGHQSMIDFMLRQAEPADNAYWGAFEWFRSYKSRRGIIPTGDVMTQFVLPVGRAFHWTILRQPVTVEARIACCGRSLELATLGFRPGPTELFRLQPRSRERDGDDEIVTFESGFRDFAWGQVAPEYLPFHAALMARVSFQTQRAELFLYALRWQGFSRRYSEQKALALPSGGTPILDRFGFDPPQGLASKLAKYFQERVPNQISETELVDVIVSLYPLPLGENCEGGQNHSACGLRKRAMETLALSPHPT